MKKKLHFEHGDLSGEISLVLKDEQSLNELFSRYIYDFNPDRLEPYGFRLLLGKENILTLFAVDNFRLENSATPGTDKIPFKKYKIPNVSLIDILHFITELNLTVSTNNYPIESIQVINK